MEEVAMSPVKVLGATVPTLLLAVLAGCGGGTPGKTSSTSFPLTISTAAGKVTIPHRPARIVSLSATATEDLYAVGAGPQVVAVDSYSTYPDSAPRTTLSGFTPNIEATAGYRPDLVLASDDTKGLVGQLGKLGIPVLVEPPATDLGGVYAQIEQIGKATGHSDQAAAAVSGIRQEIQATLKSVPPSSRALSFYHELDQKYYSATSQTFVGQIYKLVGLRNVADSSPGSSQYPQLSAEYVIAANPDLIVLADTDCCNQSLATVRERPGWSVITAVKTGAVVAVKDEIASRWGPRIVLFLRAIVDELKALHTRSA
jgi:iron complex transport system substrate-binding protein